MIVIGLGHKFGVGKDAAAAFLVERHGFVRRGFADGLKEEVLERMPRVLDEVALLLELDPSPALRRKLLYETKPPVVRALLQAYGTDVRRADDDAYWIDQTAKWLVARRRDRVVITDVRFRNEAEFVRQIGDECRVVRVDRPQANWVSASAAAHASETELDGFQWDYVLDNGGATLDCLCYAVDEMVKSFGI